MKKYTAENKDSVVMELIEENRKSRMGDTSSVTGALVGHLGRRLSDGERDFLSCLNAIANIQQNHGFATGLMYLSLSQFPDEVVDALNKESKVDLSAITGLGIAIDTVIGKK